MYYESTLVQVVQKVVVHKEFFRQSHCFKYIVTLTCQTSTGLDVWQVVRRVLYLRPGRLR
jgi:hypothetical protein